MNETLRILIVDDHIVVRKGICALLATEQEIEVVGEACDGADAILEANRLRPDVILMDLVMPRVDGVEATRRILATQPSVRILVLTSFDADDKIFPAIRAGATGYTLKDSSPEDLVMAIRRVYRGESSLHPMIARRVLRELANPLNHDATDEALTDREIEVLRLIAHGASNHEIGVDLGISEATVRKHVSNILGKLHLASRTQAALYALREGFTSLQRNRGVA